MRKHPEVLWSEGMFLRPHHLQAFARQLGGQIADTCREVQPLLWGFAELEVAEDQLEAFTFAVRRCDALLRDGARVHLPTNLRVAPRDFKDALNAAGGRLPVYLGVPAVREGEPNTLTGSEVAGGPELRYLADSVEVADENLGGAPQAVEVRKVNGRLFFGDESRDGYECLPVAMVQRAGYGSHAPVLAPELIPPVTAVGAWPPLAKLCESVLHRVEAKQRFLRAEVAEGRVAIDAAGTTDWQPVFKLQIVGSFLHVLRQLIGAARVHPFQLYLELARLAGELSIFEEQGAEAISVPLYDHDRLGECFHPLVYTLEQLLEKILAGAFVRVDFELEGELLVAHLRAEWLASGSELYLCIDSELDDRQVQGRIETAKVGASIDIPLLKQRRLFGLDIELLKRAPGGLPARENLHYYSIAKEGPYWETVVARREIAISGGIDPRLKFYLYIVTRPEGGRAAASER